MRYLIFYLVGIGLFQLTGLVWPVSLVLCGLSFLLIVLRFRKIQRPEISGICAFVFFSFLGTGISDVSNLENQSGRIGEKPQIAYTGMVREEFGMTGQFNKYRLSVRDIFVNDNVLSYGGDILIYVKENIEPGDIVLIEGSWKAPDGPKNPFEFDYRAHLKNQGVEGVHFVDSGKVKLIDKQPLPLITRVVTFLRKNSLEVIQESIRSKREHGVAAALLVGQKADLDRDLRDDYARTGAMHVLAVSGLHVGILFVAIGKIISRFPGKEWMKQGFILIVLWLFAGITGFSPSVVRATSMFSLYILGLILNRKSSIYNTIALAALLMLMIDPGSLADIGFQLSFLAVLSIVFLQPRIYKLFCIRNAWLDRVWQLTSVGIAAQLGTFPIGLYYFKQFPTYFFISNLIVIPMAFVVVNLGLVLLILSFTGGVQWIGKVIQWLLFIANEGIVLISGLPGAVVKVSTISVMEVLLLYSIMASYILLIDLRKFIWMIALGIAVFLFLSAGIPGKLMVNEPRIVVYSLNKGHCVDFFESRTRFTSFSNLEDSDLDFRIHPSRRVYGEKQVGVKSKIVGSQSELFVFHGNSFLVLREKVDLATPFKLDYLLLTGNESRADWLDSWEAGKLIVSADVKPWERRKIVGEYYDLRDGAVVVGIE